MYKTDNLAAKLSAKNILNADYSDKRILIRSCLNVAMDKSGKISDRTRVDEALPTIKKLSEKAKQIVIMAHLGRPTPAREPEFSLEPVRVVLENELATEVKLIKEYTDYTDLTEGKITTKIVLLENIRFSPGEESKNLSERENFARELAKLGDIYVNDAFPDYREAASTYDIAKYLPSYLGPVFVREVEAMSNFANPKRPFLAILGGAKLSEKLDALNALAQSADKVIIGGAMAYTLLLSDGVHIGKSLVEADKLEIAKEILAKYRDKLILPVDHVVASEFSSDSEVSTIPAVNIPEDRIAVDIGPETQRLFVNEIKQAKSILWNGPMGVFEWEQTAQGTRKVGQAIVDNKDAYKFAGGGDSIAAINKFDLTGFDHISTGGGAMLAFLSYDTFPTLDIILNN